MDAVTRKPDKTRPGTGDSGRASWRLGSQITAMVAGGLLIMVIATAIFSSLLISSALSNDYMRNGKNIATVLAEQVRVYVLIGNPEGARRSVEVVRLFPGMESAAVYEFDGNVLSHFGDVPGWLEFDTGHYAGLRETALEREKNHYWQFIAPVFADRAEPVLEDQEAVAEQKSLIGWVRIRISKSQLSVARFQIIMGNIAVISCFSLLLLFALRRLGNFLTRPLEDFVETMRASAMGQDHSLRVDLSGSLETRQLSHSFNDMMQVLEERDDALASARDQALDAARLKSEFAANVSHEIRTPLNGIVGTLNLLRRSGLNARQQEYVALAESASDALVELINDILDFSRLNLNQASVNQTAFDMHMLLEELVVLHASAPDAEHIDMWLDYDPALPFVLQSDPNKIRQLLNNFLSNALKFTDSGTVVLSVRKETEHGETVWVRLAVKDSGIGIAEQEQARIFQPYAQSDGSTTRKQSGTGLGLAISEKIAELLQGDIGVVSEEGEGSEFFVRLPCRIAGLPAKLSGFGAAIPGARLRVCADTVALAGYLASVATGIGEPALHGNEPGFHVAAENTSSEDFTRWLDGLDGGDIVVYAQSRASPDAAFLAALKSRVQTGLRGLVIVAAQDANSLLHANYWERNSANKKTRIVAAPLRLRDLREAVAGLLGYCGPAEPVGGKAQLDTCAGARALVVDDNEINLSIAAAMLRELGCVVSVAEDGIAAQRLFNNNVFDIVFMDCRMPGMNGFEVTRWIRQQQANASVPIVAMTANFEPQDQVHCFDSGMNDFLAKPVKLGQLASVLGKWVGKLA